MLRVLTYNVHSCVGTDRRHDPDRVAEVIAAAEPDIIALQELDVGRMRTGRVDQAERIADHLKMVSHFHPALHVEEERYGDAILTALPSRLIKAGPLPSIGEPRGAIWIEVDFGGERLQVINTHLGLRRRERMLQAQTLVGEDWTGSTAWQTSPGLLLGDFNATPSSNMWQMLAARFRPGLAQGGRAPAPTFPSRLPLLRLDHIFVNHRVRTATAEAVRSADARRASDHLPLLAILEIFPPRP